MSLGPLLLASPTTDDAPRATSGGVDDGDALMGAWRSGDERAFSRIVEVFGPPLLRFLRRQLGDPHKAQDAWSETFYRVVRARDSYVPQGHFRAWIYSIARRCGLDQRRAHRRFLRLANRLVEAAVPARVAPPAEIDLLQSERAKTLRAAEASLSELQRTLLTLIYQEELSSEEAGVVVGLTAQQVRNKTSYARRLLANQLDNPWEDEHELES